MSSSNKGMTNFFQNVWDYRCEECGTSCVRTRSVAVPLWYQNSKSPEGCRLSCLRVLKQAGKWADVAEKEKGERKRDWEDGRRQEEEDFGGVETRRKTRWAVSM